MGNCNTQGICGTGQVEILNDDTSTTSSGYSVVQGGLPTGTIDGGANIYANPMLVRDAEPGLNGIDDDFGTLRLRAGSPRIDAGDNSAPGLADVLTNMEGADRFFDDSETTDTGNGLAPIVDRGAYEFHGLIGDLDDGGDVDLTITGLFKSASPDPNRSCPDLRERSRFSAPWHLKKTLQG